MRRAGARNIPIDNRVNECPALGGMREPLRQRRRNFGSFGKSDHRLARGEGFTQRRSLGQGNSQIEGFGARPIAFHPKPCGAGRELRSRGVRDSLAQFLAGSCLTDAPHRLIQLLGELAAGLYAGLLESVLRFGGELFQNRAERGWGGIHSDAVLILAASLLIKRCESYVNQSARGNRRAVRHA